MDLISEAYKDLCTEMHRSTKWGKHGHEYTSEFLPYVIKRKCSEILDYGCGRNTVRTHLAQIAPSITVRSFDPAIPEFSALPQPAQFVLCVNVMEHVEEEFVPNVLSHIHSLSQRGAFFNIALSESKKVLPDGRNAHITVQEPKWWVERIRKLPWRIDKIVVGTKTLRLWITAGKKA